MKKTGPTQPRPRPTGFARPVFVYSLGLFATAAAAVGFSMAGAGGLPAGTSGGTAVFFFLFGLYTIEMGYTHPRLGYVSFDRVAQVASILVLGPVIAALVNGLASLVFPWRRLLRGAPLAGVVTASLHNAGLMTLIVLVPGGIYVLLGGAVPLMSLEGATPSLLVVLVLGMQLLNDAGMRVYLRLRDGTHPELLNLFALAVEVGAGLTAVLVAIVFNRMEASVVALLLVVLAAGMMALTQFARMRTRLEHIVADRTRSLEEKTLQLERLAVRDQLTGLYNRRFADEELDRRIASFVNGSGPFSIALLDLDHFKSVNDRYSHEAGDELLRRIARIFEGVCRDEDVVARYGGEEFLVFFPGTETARAAQLCDGLRTSVLRADWSDVAPGVMPSLSAGVACMSEGASREDLLRLADERLYRAKSQGRNQVVC